ncbi:hypothetical protein D5400_11425 [Georhizobium profundi]|uniref:Uncharacterized protein n=1 Tax=Georhizobium profundi TaxID=2341112 RepID=A0A3Q8XQZ8_9HYPH|nr:hypothetical protein [Georhizobium profundi]AZN71801.1 hypothetical protein D5400_11425 [Georhizobium profundi]
MTDKHLRHLEEAIRRTGEVAAELGRAAGKPIFYTDPAHPEGIIKEYPDGSRDLIDRKLGEERLLAHLGPRLPNHAAAE